MTIMPPRNCGYGKKKYGPEARQLRQRLTALDARAERAARAATLLLAGCAGYRRRTMSEPVSPASRRVSDRQQLVHQRALPAAP